MKGNALSRTVEIALVAALPFVSAPNAAGQQVIATIPFAGLDPTNAAVPNQVAIDDVNNVIYAPISNYLGGHGRVAVIDGFTNTVVDVIATEGNDPFCVAYNPVEHKVYVANQNLAPGGLTVIDATSNTILKYIYPPGRAAGVAVNTSTNTVYASQQYSSLVWVIDGVTDTPMYSIDVGAMASGPVVVDPVHNRVFLQMSQRQNVRVIDGATNAVSILPVACSTGMALDYANNRLYVGTWDSTLAVFDLSSLEIIDDVYLDPFPLEIDWPRGVGFNPNTNRIFVSRVYSRTVLVLDAATLEIFKTLPDAGNSGLAVNESTNKVYVCDRLVQPDVWPGEIHVIDDPTLADAVQNLIEAVMALNLHHGIANSLDAKLESVLNALDDLNEHNDVAAINSLEAFINAVEAQRGDKIPEADADSLIAAARAIIDGLSR